MLFATYNVYFVLTEPSVSSLQQYEVVPATPLVTSEVLREETDQWTDVKQGLSLALQEMRVDQVREVKSFTKNYCDV